MSPFVFFVFIFVLSVFGFCNGSGHACFWWRNLCVFLGWLACFASSVTWQLFFFNLLGTMIFLFHADAFPSEQIFRHYSFARTFTTLASSLGFECGCVCPQTGQICSYSLILLCSVLCGVFGSVPLGRASRACLGCPCCGWPLPVRFSCGFLPWRCGAPLFRCCCSVILVWLSSPFLFALVAWELAVWPALSWFPPFPPPLVVF